MSFDRRFLVGVAVALVTVAAVLGVLVVSPMMLTDADIHVDAGLIVNALAAAGAFSAAAVAVWIATTDRRDRKLKDDAADEARAKLVILSTARPAKGGELDVLVRNLGPEPVVDLTFVRLDVEGHPQLDLVPSRHSHFPVLTTGKDQNRKEFIVGLANNGEPFRKALMGYSDPTAPAYEVRPDANWIPPTITADTILTTTVQFKDLNGNTWQRTASNRAVDEDRLDESLRIGAVRRLR